ncbi:MAG: protein TolR [Thiohalomonadaceae bacterium]
MAAPQQPIRKRRRPMGEINVVPYIDVMLVLLVIFMVTAPLLTQGVKVDLPQATAEPVTSSDGHIVVITVDNKGSYHLNLDGEKHGELPLTDLVHRVVAFQRLHPKTPVNVGGDRNANYGKVVQLIAALKQKDILKVGLLTEPPEG